jgi:hypothetical protein
MATLRKTYFVNTRLQLTLIVGANVLALISALLLVTLMIYGDTHIQNYATGLNLSPNHPALKYIAEREQNFDRICIAIMCVQFVLFNATALALSHRLAGPLFRLQRHMNEVGTGGEPVAVHFRKGDLYQELAEACNTVIARVRSSAAST